METKKSNALAKALILGIIVGAVSYYANSKHSKNLGQDDDGIWEPPSENDDDDNDDYSY